MVLFTRLQGNPAMLSFLVVASLFLDKCLCLMPGVLSDGKEVAVKRLFINTHQWADQFFNEEDLIIRVRHKNLVKLLGCSLDGPENLLVYEYCCNRSLDLFVFAPSQVKKLEWGKRLEIIRGIADGLCYLHEESDVRIIHRDIKASNVLLDEKLRPKITDFGLAKTFGSETPQHCYCRNTKQLNGVIK